MREIYHLFVCHVCSVCSVRPLQSVQHAEETARGREQAAVMARLVERFGKGAGQMEAVLLWPKQCTRQAGAGDNTAGCFLPLPLPRPSIQWIMQQESQYCGQGLGRAGPAWRPAAQAFQILALCSMPGDDCVRVSEVEVVPTCSSLAGIMVRWC